jgi:hypothetical protein
MPPLRQVPPDGFVPMLEAVQRLGKSDRTIRRMIAAGTLEGEPIARPQGTIWYVRLPPEFAAETAADAAPGGDVISDQENDDAATLAAVTALDAALRRAEERAAALDERNERQAGMMVEQAERIGKLTAKLDAAAAEATDLRRQLDESRRPWWKRILR